MTNEKVWATALVVAYLQSTAAGRAEEWEIVVQKALDWLQGSAWGQVSSILEAAKSLLLATSPA